MNTERACRSRTEERNKATWNATLVLVWCRILTDFFLSWPFSLPSPENPTTAYGYSGRSSSLSVTMRVFVSVCVSVSVSVCVCVRARACVSGHNSDISKYLCTSAPVGISGSSVFCSADDAISPSTCTCKG